MARKLSNVKKPIFDICPHEDAPLFSDFEKGQTIIRQLITEVQSKRMVQSNELRSYLRQLSLVSLWFCLKFVAGFSGPYDKLNTEIHLEMANWRQSDSCMRPGARGAGFVPRSFYKSTIWGHGACIWEIIRFPNIRIRYESNKFEKAAEFLGNVKDCFENNEMMHWLFPETMIPKGYAMTGKWASDRIIIPSRTRHFTEATMVVGSAQGASEGGHCNLYVADDDVGQDDLDAQGSSGVDMYRKKRRYINNKTSLLDEPKIDRDIVLGTRYATDDMYEIMVNDAYEFIGYKVPEFTVKPDGEWSVYNRLAEEDGVYIYPEKIDQKALQKAMEEDMWYAMTQLMNYPQKTGLAEFTETKPRFATLEYLEEYNDWVIRYEADTNFDEVSDVVFLKDCDVVMSVDPAGTDRGISAKTSRTSIGVWAHDSSDRVTRIFSRVGYFSTNKMFDFMFEAGKLFEGYIRESIVEANATQKQLVGQLIEEQYERAIYINPQPKAVTVDKVVRIRNTVGLKLAKGQLYLAHGCSKEFLEEHMVFPMSQYRMDTLDESAKGISGSYRPLSKADTAQREEHEAEQRALVDDDNVFGY
jgi:hypothetical protein